MSDPPRLPRQYNFPGIPEPTSDIQSLLKTVQSLKEVVELLTGQRGINEFARSFSIQGALTEIQNAGSRVYELQEAGVGLARRVTGVETVADDVSASGQVVISAEANPTGYKAYFGVYLRANADTTPGTERRAGLHLGLDNSDGAVFALDVDKYILRDNASGDSSAVFTYSGGAFTMTGNVTINGSLMVTNTIQGSKIVDLSAPTEKIAYNAIGQFYQTTGGSWSTGSGWTTVADRTIVGVTGGYVFFLGMVRTDSVSAGTITAGLRIRRTSDGSILREVPLNIAEYGGTTTPVLTSISCFHSDGGSNYTYELQINPGGVTLSGDMIEFSVEVRKR